MNSPELTCDGDERRHHARVALNGIDYVEVSEDQRVLDLHFFQPPPADLRKDNIRISGGTRIPEVAVLEVKACPSSERDSEERLWVIVEQPGDFSLYTLSLVQRDAEGNPVDTTLPGFDPRYSKVRFSFKASCPSDLDCQTQDACQPPARTDPEIDYLAKDYASFRQLMLDRLSVTMPEWTERHVPDLGVALVEVLAYVGDYLSYHQDAVATEAYLGTARRRTSIRRHARLVDYQLHEGTNARAWIHIRSVDDFSGEQALDPKNVFFLSVDSDVSTLSPGVLTLDDIRNVPFDRYEVFEPLDRDTRIELFADQTEIAFYTWGNTRCCLPRGATAATLQDVSRPTPAPTPVPEQQPYAAKPPQEPYDSKQPSPSHPGGEDPGQVETPVAGLTLQPGNYLLFEEIRGPETGNPADADPTHRHVVRLTRVTPAVDPLTKTGILEIEWAEEDALPFPLCLSTIVGAGCGPVDVSVARGNMLLVDHGRMIENEPLGNVPRETLVAGCEGPLCAGEISVTAGPFRPSLEHGPLIFALPLDRSAAAVAQTPRQPAPGNVVPVIRIVSIPGGPEGVGPLVPYELFNGGDWDQFAVRLRRSQTAADEYLRGWLGRRLRQQLASGDLGGEKLREAVARLPHEWTYRPDLLGSTSEDRHFTFDVGNDRRAHLRFGDGELGRQPEAGAAFLATYRIGDPIAGNVGAERISHIVFRAGVASGIDLRPRNPLPAIGGTPPETVAAARLFAPHRFRTERQRAITADDYAHFASTHPKVQRAAAVLQWTGNGYEALVAIDQRDRAEADPRVLTEVAEMLDPYRRIGHSVRTITARLVPLRLKLTVCVQPGYQRGHVKAAVLESLGSRDLLDGRRGYFHPDNLTFGQSIFLSPIVARVQALAGVESVIVNEIERLFDGPAGERESGVLPIGALEIARLDNDPSLPENGRLELDMRGGR